MSGQEETLLNILIYNLGNRDLKRNGNLVPNAQDWEQLLSQIELGSVSLEELQFEQFEAVLSYLHRRGLKQLDRVYIVVTDQNPDKDFRKTDTVSLYKVLQRCFDHYRSTGLGRSAGQGVPSDFLGKTALKHLTMSGENPADYARVFDWYRRHLASVVPQSIDTQKVNVWIYPVSGTPAMTLGLMMASVLRWGERVRCLMQAPGAPVEENPWPTKFISLLLLNRLEDRICNFDLAAAASLATEPPIRHLVLATLARSHFDFKKADEELDKVMASQADTHLVSRVRQMRKKLQALLSEPHTPSEWKPFLVELIFNARMCWRAGRDIDFLGRIYRLHEAILRYLLETAGFPTDDSPRFRTESRARFWSRLHELGLQDSLNQKDPEISSGGPLNRPTFMAVVKALLDRQPPGVELPPIQDLLKLVGKSGLLDELGKMRNSTILGHGFQPVDHDEIQRKIKKYSGQEPEDWLLGLATQFDPEAADPFEQARDLIRDLIESRIAQASQ